METDPTETACPPGADYTTWANAKGRDFRNGIFRRVVTDLAPYFDKNPANLPIAKGMAMYAVMSLMPEEEADWFNAADIVSLSLTSIDLLKDAATLDMPPAMKLRFVGRAIQASKEAREVEVTLQKRRKEREAMSPERIRRIRNPVGYTKPEPRQPQPAAPSASAAFAGMAAEIEAMMREAAHAAQADAAEPDAADAQDTAAADDAPHVAGAADAPDADEADYGPHAAEQTAVCEQTPDALPAIPSYLPHAPSFGAEPAANGPQPASPRHPSPLATPATSEPAPIETLATIAPWLTAKGPDGQPINVGDFLAAELTRQMQLIKPLRPYKSTHPGKKRRTG